MRDRFAVLCLCMVILFSCATITLAQESSASSTMPDTVTIRPYGSLAIGAYLILPGVEVRVGAKQVGIPELEIRADVAAYVPGLYKLALDALYNIPLEFGSELYVGGGGRLFFAQDIFSEGGTVFGLGILAGLETPLASNAASYFEFGGNVFFTDNDFDIPIIPQASFGLKLYF